MKSLSRRTFISKSVSTVAAAGLSASLTSSVWAQPKGANEDIRIGIVGVGWKGGDHCDDFYEAKGARVVAICDADQLFLDEQVEKFKQRRQTVKTYRDVRNLLDDKDIDAVVIATPNHWHALMMIWACQAGKDVYLEKPVSYDIWEGRRLLEAQKKYGRIIQGGTQKRSNTSYDEAIEFMRGGALGAIQSVHGFDYKHRRSLGRIRGPQLIPSTVDYDLYQGPAPMRPLRRSKLHYDWHWQWETGNGDIGNIGAHVIDNVRRIMGDDRQPKRVASLGGRFVHNDDGETPNELLTYLDYGDFPVFAEVRGLPYKPGVDYMDNLRGSRQAVVVECEDGYLVFGFGGVSAYNPDKKRIKAFSGESKKAHIDNFISAVRNQDAGELNCPLKIGVQGAELCHLANISYRSGFPASEKKIRDQIGGTLAGDAAIESVVGNLTRNKVDLDVDQLTLGPWVSLSDDSNVLTVDDPKSELVAQELFRRRVYREPFVVPFKV